VSVFARSAAPALDAPALRSRRVRRDVARGVLAAVAATLLGGALPASARAAGARFSVERVDDDSHRRWSRHDRHGWRRDSGRDWRGHWGSGAYGSWHRVPPRHGWAGPGWDRPGWRGRWDGARHWAAPCPPRSNRGYGHRHPHGRWGWRHR